MKILIVIAALLCFGCKSTKEWTGGLVPSGKDLTPDQKIAEHTKFAIEAVAGDYVHIREGDDTTRYTISSYKPVLDQLNPTIYQQWDDQRIDSTLAILGAGISGLSAGYASDEERSEARRYAGMAGVVIGALMTKYFGGKIDRLNQMMKNVFNTELEFKLFGPVPEPNRNR